ncbi:MAG TPA: Flp family type IVb pilin [Rhizomicrobium sp.]|nr:Flp family type IVb pilin [Rhizomicrobium sp.]
MGPPQPDAGLSHAGGRPAADPHAARSALGRFARDARGSTAMEYALIGALISIMIVTGVTTIGTKLSGFFDSVTFSP